MANEIKIYKTPGDHFSMLHKKNVDHLSTKLKELSINIENVKGENMKTILFPGQGAQFKGMGKELFGTYPKQTEKASEILGYSIEELCLEDPNKQLALTQFTQPALYVVNALNYLKKQEEEPGTVDFFIGHSLGEYNALLAAGAFDFETGLKLVQKRGKLMGKASGGGMAAVLGVKADDIKTVLDDNALTDIDLANYNMSTQTVISGTTESIKNAQKIFREKKMRCIPLNVSAAFHSRYMRDAQKEFAEFLKQFKFSGLKTPVIANATARPYDDSKLTTTLSDQIASSVLWTESIRYLMGRGEMEFVEIGSAILTKMVTEITKTETPLIIEDEPKKEVKEKKLEKVETEVKDDTASSSKNKQPADKVIADKIEENKKQSSKTEASVPDGNRFVKASSLGSKEFREEYGIKYAYLTGAMVRGIASKELVIRQGKAGLMSYFGTGGLSMPEIEEAIQEIQKELTSDDSYGMNLLCNLERPEKEMETVELYIKHKIHYVEAAAFMQMTPALVFYRLKGLRKDENGTVCCDNKILGKLSRPEVAEAFMSPAPERTVKRLFAEGVITQEQAELSKTVAMSYDICIEADSGGHTDGGIPTVLVPSIMSLRKEMQKKYNYDRSIRIGQAGGIGTPEAVAAAFIMGVDFVLTGSINQCTVQGGISDSVKNMLQEINVQDTAYAPAGDMFEIGARVQVLKKGVFFPARANKLYQLYTNYNSLDELPEKTKSQLEEKYFKKTFDEIWKETKTYFEQSGGEERVERAEKNPKHKMSLVFQWYFRNSMELAFNGDEENRINYQVHTGPALGAFNQWVKGTELEDWRNRHVDDIAEKLMQGTAELLNERYQELNS